MYKLNTVFNKITSRFFLQTKNNNLKYLLNYTYLETKKHKRKITIKSIVFITHWDILQVYLNGMSTIMAKTTQVKQFRTTKN